MRRNADDRIRQVRRDGARALDELKKPVRIVEKAALAGQRRGTTEIPVAVERRQQREADAALFGRGGDARRHLADIAVRPAVSCVVQVMEFADAGEAAL